VQYQFLAGSFDKPGEPMHPFPGCSLVAIPCRPESRGWLRIKSPDPRVAAGDAAELSSRPAPTRRR
jgi:choline dehydrogenase